MTTLAKMATMIRVQTGAMAAVGMLAGERPVIVATPLRMLSVIPSIMVRLREMLDLRATQARAIKEALN
jgi:hypothetical protein